MRNGFTNAKARHNEIVFEWAIASRAYNVFRLLCRTLAKPSPPDYAQSMRGVCAKYAAGMKTSTHQREQGECLT